MYQSCMSHGCGGTVNMGSPSESDRYFTGWPSYMIDASAVRNRAMEWISFLEGATGELYWESAFAFARGTGRGRTSGTSPATATGRCSTRAPRRASAARPTSRSRPSASR